MMQAPTRPSTRSPIALMARAPAAAAVTFIALTVFLATHLGTFAVVNTVLLRVLPVEDLDRLVHIWDNLEISPGERHSYSVKPANYLEWKKRQSTMARMGTFEPRSFNLTGEGEPVRLQGAFITHDLMPAFGVEPLLGRNVTEAEDRPGAAPVAILSHDLWQDRFAAHPEIVGRKIEIDNEEHTVVGVMPPGFYHPWHTQIWISMRLEPDSPRMQEGYLTVIGFMKPGVTIKEARADFLEIARQLEREFPETNSGWEVEVAVLRHELVGDIQPKLLALLGGSALLLAVACSPLALLLGFSARGRGGPSGARFSALLPAGLLIAVAAGVLGWIAALACTETVVGMSSLVIFTSYFKTIHFDSIVLLYAVGAILVTGVLLAGLAARIRRPGPVVAMASAVFLVTLATAALLSFGYLRKANADYGFSTDDLFSMRFSLPASRYTDPQKRRDFFAELLERTRQIPEVEAAGVATDHPFAIHTRSARHSVEGYEVEPGTTLVVQHRLVSPGYLETLGIRLLEGRSIEASDTMESPKVAVVNQTFAERYWPGESALGKRVKQGYPDSDRPWLTVVGVVNDIQEDGREPTIHRPSWYIPAAQYDDLWEASIVVRTAADYRDVAASIRGVVAEIDPDQPAYEVRTLEQFRDRYTLFQLRFYALLANLTAALGLLLAAAAFVARRSVGALAEDTATDRDGPA